MKKILLLSLMFLFSVFYGQNMSDYKYIYVPKEFADAKTNKYGLNQLLASKLKTKKYIITNDAIEVNCETLKAEIIDTSNFLTNKLKIDFKDCYNKTIVTFEGKSSTKDIDAGMREALQLAANKFSVSNPVQKETTIQNSEQATTTETKAEIFSNGFLTLNKINISTNHFILANPNHSTPYAIFESSTKKEMYRVQLENGTQTLGYFENGAIIIEIPTTDGSFRKEIFMKK